MRDYRIVLLLFIYAFFSCSDSDELTIKRGGSDLLFADLPTSWDCGLPLGNGFVGELVWQRDSVLRLSLDRIDLWDLSPCDSLKGKNFSYRWIYEQWKKGEYQPVHDKFDIPYDRNAVPTKLPGAALEFDISSFGKPKLVVLALQEAVAEVKWESGVRMRTFVDATESTGWFEFKGVPEGFEPLLVPPRYQLEGEIETGHPVNGHDLRRLGYKQGKVTKENNRITYHQKGYGGFAYDVEVFYHYDGDKLIGVWSISSTLSTTKRQLPARALVDNAMRRGMRESFRKHAAWWKGYWAKSSVDIPDKVLQKQYHADIYKFGCSTRPDGYIIPLQGVWTADNGLLPPWKGDVHNDLNTQLSYWPAYKGNLLDDGMSYLNTLWEQRDVNRRYTRAFFGRDGLAVPGVATLTGEPMGGWIQYSLSPTVSGWLAHHFYLHWRYSLDATFLKERAYPYVREVAVLFENITEVDSSGVRSLPFSSSPEINDNRRTAWFPTMTNFDLAIVKNTFFSAAIMAASLNMNEDEARWISLLHQLPDFDLDQEMALTFAKGKPYNESHRHLSHAMAIHPFSILDVTRGGFDSLIVKQTIRKLDSVGPDWWTGYSYSWLGNLKARALDADGAVEALRTFAQCFCLPNTFHANGDQTKSGKSKYHYKPFTLEGNFAFASGVQELLMQCHTPVLRIFPATPSSWENVSFDNLRAEGAFLVSAEMKNGEVEWVKIHSEHGSELRMENPFTSDFKVKGTLNAEKVGNQIVVPTQTNQTIVFERE